MTAVTAAEPRAAPLTLLVGGLVWSPDAPAGTVRDILIEADTIKALAPPGAFAALAVDARIDLTDRAVIPGLVNAHTHSHGGLSKGIGDRWTLELLLHHGAWAGGSRAAEDRHLSATLTAIALLESGCTAAFDLALSAPFPTEEDIAAVATAYRDMGLRAVIAPMVGDIAFHRAIAGMIEAAPPGLGADLARAGAADGAFILERIEGIARGWSFAGDGIGFAVAPTIPLHSTDAYMQGCHRIAAAHGLALQTHLAESRAQAAASLTRFGRPIVAHLDALGVIDERFSGAHGVWLDDASLATLADRGAAIAHNPGSNLRLGSGIADIVAARRRGVTIGVGTDGGASSDHQNMFEATRLAANLTRVRGRPAEEWVSAPDALALATEGSARVLGLGHAIGRIAPGYKADLAVLDLTHPHYVPLNDLTNQVVHVENGSALDMVFVGGRLRVAGGRALGVDRAALRAKAEAARERLTAANAGERARAERLAPFVGRFCHGLACGCAAQVGQGWIAEAP
jgi:guanine deaminase